MSSWHHALQFAWLLSPSNAMHTACQAPVSSPGMHWLPPIHRTQAWTGTCICTVHGLSPPSPLRYLSWRPCIAPDVYVLLDEMFSMRPQPATVTPPWHVLIAPAHAQHAATRRHLTPLHRCLPHINILCLAVPSIVCKKGMATGRHCLTCHGTRITTAVDRDRLYDPWHGLVS